MFVRGEDPYEHHRDFPPQRSADLREMSKTKATTRYLDVARSLICGQARFYARWRILLLVFVLLHMSTEPKETHLKLTQLDAYQRDGPSGFIYGFDEEGA